MITRILELIITRVLTNVNRQITRFLTNFRKILVFSRINFCFLINSHFNELFFYVRIV
uniref:Uncharacterized protein n=1 Tax=virus sp. ctqq75 TaxID=2827999 RepID=A0A8S5RE15_9VIRU|nr:MAG TPA: hypothetical protein [virus sp. ctqq75]